MTLGIVSAETSRSFAPRRARSPGTSSGDVELLFGDTIQGITSDTAQVQFTNNGVREFELAIGADGLHSNLRRIVFGEESRFLGDPDLYLCPQLFEIGSNGDSVRNLMLGRLSRRATSNRSSGVSFGSGRSGVGC